MDCSAYQTCQRCGKRSSFGVAGTRKAKYCTKTSEYCAQDAPDGMVNVERKICGTEGCGKFAAFAVAGAKTAEYCIQHSHDGMVGGCSRKCRGKGCGKQPSLEYWTQHALDGMVNVKGRRCGTEGCGKQPSFGVTGTKTAEYCRQHALDGMVNVKNRVCRTEGCDKVAAFGVTGTKMAVQMTSSRVIDKMVVDEGRALQPCRYRLFTQVLYYSLPIQHITVPWVHTRDNQHRRKQLPTRTTTHTLNVGKVT